MKTRGFTLIELLVVITVIALLIMILLPALSAVKKMGSLAQCSANKHDIGVAVIGYVADFGSPWPVQVEYDEPWMSYFLAVTTSAQTTQMPYTWGNPATALTKDMDPYLRGQPYPLAGAGIPDLNPGPPISTDPFNGVAGNTNHNPQNYLKDASYFRCPLFSSVKYKRNYFRYGNDASAAWWNDGNVRFWGTDDWLYGYGPAGGHTNLNANNAVLSDFFDYDFNNGQLWWPPVDPVAWLPQAKWHCNLLTIDGSVRNLGVKGVHDYLYGAPANPTSAYTINTVFGVRNLPPVVCSN
jgi:prepilin-type N-terminal cleavage/methylation domain-containing protein